MFVGEVKKKNWLTVKWKRLTILKFVVRTKEWSEKRKNTVGKERKKIFRDDFHRNFYPVSVFNSKVMSGIMRVIVVDAIQAEWMVLLPTFSRWWRLWKSRMVRGYKINSIICELCSNELCFCYVGDEGKKVKKCQQ